MVASSWPGSTIWGGGCSIRGASHAVFVTLSQAALVLQLIDLTQDVSGAVCLIVDWETVDKTVTFLLFPCDCDHSKASLIPLVVVSVGDTYLLSNRSVLRAVQILQRTHERMSWVMPEGGRQVTFMNLAIISLKGVSAAMWTAWWRGTEFHTCAAKGQVKKRCVIVSLSWHLMQSPADIPPLLNRLTPKGSALWRIDQRKVFIFGEDFDDQTSLIQLNSSCGTGNESCVGTEAAK